jgi:hypothetical protein
MDVNGLRPLTGAGERLACRAGHLSCMTHETLRGILGKARRRTRCAPMPPAADLCA